jgi:hypothetical protein
MAPTWVDALGVETLQKHKVAPATLESPAYQYDDLDLDESQTDDMIAAFGDCDVDIRSVWLKLVSSGMTDEQKSCLSKELDEPTVHTMLSSAMRLGADNQGGAMAKQLEKVSKTCKLRG